MNILKYLISSIIFLSIMLGASSCNKSEEIAPISTRTEVQTDEHKQESQNKLSPLAERILNLIRQNHGADFEFARMHITDRHGPWAGDANSGFFLQEINSTNWYSFLNVLLNQVALENAFITTSSSLVVDYAGSQQSNNRIALDVETTMNVGYTRRGGRLADVVRYILELVVVAAGVYEVKVVTAFPPSRSQF